MQNTSTKELITIVQGLLNSEIIAFELKDAGVVNSAYYIETKGVKKYILKVEKAEKDFTPQNSLVVESTVAEKLHSLRLPINSPKVVFTEANPAMYCYEYIEGEVLRSVWKSMSHEGRIDVCKQLGKFHSEIGKQISKEDCIKLGVKINESAGLHPEVETDYEKIIADAIIPEEYINIAIKAKEIFDSALDSSVFQFLHNDGHHENILIKEREISGIIDFGESEYGEVAKEFSRYIRDFPDYYEYIVASYEDCSGNKLSRKRLVSNSFLSDLPDIIDDFKKDDEGAQKANMKIETYTRLLSKYV